MTEQQKKVGGCYAIFVFLGTISGLLLVIAAVFQMPSYMFFWTAIWIAACICIALVYPGDDNIGGFVLCEFCTLIYFVPWLDLIKSIDLFKEKYKDTINPVGYFAPFLAAFILWYIGVHIRAEIWLSKNRKEEKAEYQEQLDSIKAKMDEKAQKQAEEIRAKTAERVKAQAAPMQAVEKPAVEVIEAEPAPEPVQDTVQNPDANEERYLAEEARRKAEEAQKEAEEARQRVEEAQRRAERAAQKMEDAMKRAKLAQEQLKKAQAEAEKLKNQNKKT